MSAANLSSAPPRQATPTTVVRLEGLFNAENLAINNGRAFVTGSKGVYEVVKDDAGHHLSEIPICVDTPSDQWLRNGIASDGSRLYLACAHVHDARIPLPSWAFDNAADIEQTLSGLGKLMLAEMLCRVDLYVVAADLNRSPSGADLAFTEILASSRGAFFGNGLDVAGDGTLYVANSHPGSTGGIYRVRPGESTPELCHRCVGCSPNGVRVDGNELYYTGLQVWPYPAAVLRKVDLTAAIFKPDVSQPLVVRPASLFDDFDVLDDGFVVAEFATWRRFPFAVGGLLFFSKAGDLLEEVRTDQLVHPSSVRVCHCDGASVKAGETLITEKNGHRLLAIPSNVGWRANNITQSRSV